MHRFWEPEAFHAELNRLTVEPGSTSKHIPKALRDALDPADPAGAEAVVASYLEKSGIDVVGVRSPAEIAANLSGAASPTPAPIRCRPKRRSSSRATSPSSRRAVPPRAASASWRR